ncbi:hypothetical protein B0H11DRAFT_1932523 [Mycena galericulata]|nr:hypothetical protein B0H11DRAFT_1932523 [Mycena galericulata]
MSTKTENMVNRLPNVRAHNEEDTAAVASAPLPDADRTSAGLWADAISKGKQDLATSPPRMRGTPRRFLDSRHVTQRTATKACVHSSCYFETSSRPLQLLRIKSIWRRLTLSLLLLLFTPPLLTRMADEISSAASVLATNNINTIVAFICGGVFIVVIGFASKQLYTPETGVMRAFNGYKALCLSWDAVYARYTDAEQDEKMVDTKRKIDSAIEDLNEKISDLDTTVWWKKMHWGTSAARAYDEQHAKLKRTIDVFQSNAELRKTKHFPPPPAPTAV